MDFWPALESFWFALPSLVFIAFLTTTYGVFLLAINFHKSYTAYRRVRLYSQIIGGTILSISIGTLAWVVGFLSGISRAPAVSDLVPAVLGVFGTLAAFIGFRNDRSMVMSQLILAFGMSLFIGSTHGAKLRETHEHMDMNPNLEEMKEKSRIEFLLTEYRQGLKLDWPPLEIVRPSEN